MLSPSCVDTMCLAALFFPASVDSQGLPTGSKMSTGSNFFYFCSLFHYPVYGEQE